MWGNLAKIVGVAIALFLGGFLLSQFWNEIRDTVAAWLRDQGLQNSALMDAWIVIDGLVTSVRRRIFVKTRQTGEQKISETTHTLDEIRESYPDVYAELEKRGYVKKNIMYLFQ